MMKWILLCIAVGVIVYYGAALITKLVYGKPVFTDNSAQALRQAEEKLKHANIKYSINTVKGTPLYLEGKNSQIYGRLGMSDSDVRNKTSITYFIYVKKSVYAAAMRVLEDAD